MSVATLKAEFEIEVWDRLSAVTDPELDEPITEMNFVERVEIADDARVTVEFRLPTYWCSPNFAFLMAIGIRRAVLGLPWVRGMTVRLIDHCFGDEVNEGVNSDRDYHDVFAQYCEGANLDEVVEKFRAKAFDRRQEVMLLGLRARGLSDRAITAMTLEGLQALEFDGEEERRQQPRYLALVLEEGLAQQGADPVFRFWRGPQIRVEDLPGHLTRLRSTRINMEFNGALCRELASKRYKEVEIGPEGPTLVDFIQGRVPPRDGAASRA